jgi:hypothetical protein
LKHARCQDLRLRLLTLLSFFLVLVVAIPIVQWRDIALPILIGGACHGIGSVILRIIGLPVWTKPEKDESNGPER